LSAGGRVRGTDASRMACKHDDGGPAGSWGAAGVGAHAPHLAEDLADFDVAVPRREVQRAVARGVLPLQHIAVDLERCEEHRLVAAVCGPVQEPRVPPRQG
jgi:hypothetical protein